MTTQQELLDEAVRRGLVKTDSPYYQEAVKRGLIQGSSAPAQPENSFGRNMGLAARSAVQAVPAAVLGLPALAADAYDSVNTLMRKGVNAVAGTNYPPVQPFRNSRNVADLGRAAADSLSLPKPETKMEQGLTDIGTAGLSALGGAGVARMGSGALGTGASEANGIAAGAMNTLRRIMQGMAEQPVLQTAGAVGGAAATDFAKNAQLSPAATLGVGMVGSIAPGGAATVGQRGTNLVRGLAAPFTNPGREVVAGMALNRLATDRNMAPFRMDAAKELVPGSRPTMAQVSQDPGLISAEKTIGQTLDPSGLLMQRRSDQNAARQGALGDLVMPSRPVSEGAKPQRGTLEYAQNKRNGTIDQYMEPAFKGAGSANVEPIFGTINSIRSNPRLAPRKDVQDALSFVESRLTQDGVDVTNPESLYAIRKDVSDAIAGKYNSDKSNLALAQGQLLDVRKSIDAAIEAAAPGYQRYMDLYRKRSIPLNQQEELQRLRDGAQDAISDPATGLRILSPAKFQRTFEKAVASGALRDAKVSDRQLETLQNIAADLDRGAAINSGTIRSAGSDTMRNFSVAAVIGRVIGDNFTDTASGRALQSIATPLRWMYQVPDERIGQILVEASLDPKLASRLMRNASKYEVEFIANELAKRAAAQTAGQTVYGQKP